MRVIVCDNYENVSLKAAKIVSSQIVLHQNCILGLATGSSPIGTYNKLIEMYNSGDLDFSEVKSFNLDEYYPLSASNDQSYHYFMNEHLFSKVNINPDNVHILDGESDNPSLECENYEAAIEKMGGIDLQILGIGQNGHIGFNEPDYNLNSRTHLTDLTENTIRANSRFFKSEDEVPKQALTMGIGSILKSKKIILIATGAKKHRVIKELMNGEINTSIPATMLKVHPDVTLICDREAYESTRIGIDIGGTDIKLGVVNDNCEILYKDTIPTPVNAEAETICNLISDKCNKISKKFFVNGIGIGTPGVIKNGIVNATNLKFNNLPLADVISKKTGLDVELSNDANCAALGESKVGAAKNVDNCILITLGTGIGGGIIIGNRIYEGRGCAGEIGHICIDHNGKKCPCGLNGCFEQYASASALVRIAEEKAKENPESNLGKSWIENGKKLNGILIFSALKDGCYIARQVIDEYTDYLADGINSLVNIFDPDMIVISGGISNVGDLLIKPIQSKIACDIPVKCAERRNESGIIGASLL